MNITFGINFELIEKIEKGNGINNNIIAHGIKPINGKDGYIKMLIKNRPVSLFYQKTEK